MIKNRKVIKPQSLAGLLREQIARKGLSPGDRLPTHAELSRRYGVGVRRLREALSILRQEGLVETRRRGGTVVAEPSLEVLREPIDWHLSARGYTYDDLLEARAAMESVIAAEAARRRTTRDLLQITEAMERFEETDGPVEEAEQIDMDFHQAILQATHNPVLLVFGQLIAEQFREKQRQHRHLLARKPKRTIRDHRSIQKYIQDRRPEQARARMLKHVLQQRLDELEARSPKSRPPVEGKGRGS
ncbi:MAG: FadR family transcriptional regulator [Phycisphaerae bacterium]|nr:FadR family transcriptional regulator [Phycisphaerae bacterium]